MALNDERIAYQAPSLQIDPRVQAQRDKIAQNVIASEDSQDDLGVSNITSLGDDKMRPVAKFAGYGSHDPNAPTLSNASFTPAHNADVIVGFRSNSSSEVESAAQQKEPVKSRTKDVVVGYRPLNEPKPKVAAQEVAKSATVGDRVKDAAISGLQGVIGVPEAAVGLADLVTGGAAGKLAEDAGVRFKDSKDILEGYKSDAAHADAKAFNDANGFVDSGKVAIQHPSVIADAVIQSLPSIAGGSLFGRAFVKILPRFAAGGVGEGIVTAGQNAEQIRQQTTDGYTSTTQNALAAATGLTTGLISSIGGGVAKKLGIHDIDNILIHGSPDAVESVVKKSLARKLAEGGFSESVLEEIPQSSVEQMLNNVALDKPIMDGVDKAAALGGLAGVAMGSGAQLAPEFKPQSSGSRIIEEIKAKKERDIKSAANILATNPDELTPEQQDAHVEQQVTEHIQRNEAKDALPATDLLDDAPTPQEASQIDAAVNDANGAAASSLGEP